MLLSPRPTRTPAPPLPCPDDVVELRRAAFGYSRRPVLRGVDLTVHRGEVLAVRGPNGAGKSTLVRGLLGLSEVLAGEVRLFGEPRGQFRDWQRVGYVPQRSTVVGSVPVTVRELVSSGRLGRVGPWRRFREVDRCAVDCALEGVGLAGFDRRSVTDPELLVLDEPTAGVDAENQRVLAATLSGLAATGITVVVVVHETGPLAPVIARTVTVGGTAGDVGC